jgi:phosphoribosylaminoimidazolecarboxamide formyltransferase / IMP cyclohydrolase
MARALLSVSDKDGIVDFARALAARGFEIVSTGGTARALASRGVRVVSVSEVTGFPEMMDGRVKTLHPKIHGGILARRGRADDLAAIEQHGIGLIDLVAVNLYPFAAVAADPASPVDALFEEIDIGGPSLVRAAAKNFRDVLVVVSPADYSVVIDELDRTGGPRDEFRLMLARKAFAHTAAYDTEIATVLSGVTAGPGGFVREGTAPGSLPERLVVGLRKLRDLRYGENPHQRAAWYESEAAAREGSITIAQGKEPSFTNLLDLDAAARIVCEFDEPAAVVVKHTNPCGAATGDTLAEAYVRAREADPLSAFGGIVGLNRRIDEPAARAIVSTFIEAVIAPGVDEAARAILSVKKNMRVVIADLAALFVTAPEGRQPRDLRSVLGGFLLQERDSVQEARGGWPPPSGVPVAGAGIRVVTKRAPTADEWVALRFAWRVCAHVKSNAVVFTTANRTLAIGAGQMSRVDAVAVAELKALAAAASAGGASSAVLKGSVAASDAYFPFRDGLDRVAQAGATAVIQPGGSVRDGEVIEAADEHNLAMVFAGKRHFRH